MSLVRALPKMISMIPSVFGGVHPEDLDKIKEITREAYPSVRQLSTEKLAEWMQREPGLLLVDVRSAEQFAVSHLKGAVNLQTPEQITEAIKQQQPLKTVLYCSVGFRSSRLAQAVPEDKSAEVWNLGGSIFQWANEGRALFRGKTPVQKVHPYGRRWAGLLKPGLASGG